MSKFSVRIILATTAVAGSFLLSTANSALACPFNKLNSTASPTADVTPPLTLPNQSDFNLGIIGAGAALALALGGLAAYRASTAKAETEPQEDLLEEAFSIPIPPEVLAKAIEDADKEKVTSVG